MAFDECIKLDGVEDESQDERHKGWMEIVAYDFGASQSTSATASSYGGAGSGRATLSEFSFVRGMTVGYAGGVAGEMLGEQMGEAIYEWRP
jgi:type VI protein secretion system component Hcp